MPSATLNTDCSGNSFDVSVFLYLTGSGKFQSLLASGDAGVNVTRYYKFLSNQPTFKVAQKQLPQVKASAEKKPDKKSDQSVCI